MSNAEEVKLEIKLVINKEKTKVLFAEAGSDFTDVLLSFLLLPLATIVRLLKKHHGDGLPVIGSLSTLFNGVVNFDTFHFSEQDSRTMLLIPTSCYESKLYKLRLNVSSIKPTAVSDSGKTYGGVLTDGAASFVISDDLRVMPNVAGSIVKTLSNLGIAVTDMDGAETRIMTLGFNEIMALLMGSLVYQNPLSALLFQRRKMNLATLKYEEGNSLLHQIEERATSQNCKKMTLTVMMKKSTNKLLFAQADHEFISFLFGLLTHPLGRVEWYLGSRTGLVNIDNLHKSLADNFDGKLMASESVKGWLMKPELPNYSKWLYSNDFYHLNFDPTITQKHVKESRMYMVSDDLTVTPLGMTSSLVVLNSMNISLSDIEELELQVGLEEGLSILKAALRSTTALTDGLINPMLMKQPKQEN